MKHGRKISGGKYHLSRKKKKYEADSQTNFVKLGKERKKVRINRGGEVRTVLLSTDIANLVIKSGKSEKVKIKNVLETPSNKFLARQNILMKNALIDTDKGKARITNRPSQEGNVQARLVEENKK